ncbi:OsmC family protein [Oculatella sp. LEGE 06141]|nr:OsmC family protein [Oculatella sp. LEGE 06141]
MVMQDVQPQTINGIDTHAVTELLDMVVQDFTQGITKFEVTTAWAGGTATATRVESWQLGGNTLPRKFTIRTDEPEEFCGGNTAPNPQETLMAAMNACMTVGYVVGCAMHGIELEMLEIESEGELDLRGFFGLDDTVKPGYDKIQCTVHIKGNGTPEQFQAIHETVMATSPNFWNITNAVSVKPSLSVE